MLLVAFPEALIDSGEVQVEAQQAVNAQRLRRTRAYLQAIVLNALP
jgi:hypothetical protein